MTPEGNTSQSSSTPLPWKTFMSTWTTSFQLSMDTPGRGAKCSVTSSTRSSGFSALTSSQTPTVKTPSPKRSWGKKMGPGPPVRQSLGGTFTKSPTCYALPLDKKRRWRPHWKPFPGRRTLPHCANGARSCGCCEASPWPSPDRGACSHGYNMPQKSDREARLTHSRRAQ